MVSKVETVIWSKYSGRDKTNAIGYHEKIDSETDLDFILRVMKSIDNAMGNKPLAMYTSRQWLVDIQSMTATKTYTEHEPADEGKDYGITLVAEIHAI
jgi:hypothetical protein